MSIEGMISAWVVLLIALGAVEQYLMVRDEVTA